MYAQVAVTRWHVVGAAGGYPSIHLSLVTRWYVQIISFAWFIIVPVPFRVGMDLHLRSEDRTISSYPLSVHLCNSHLNCYRALHFYSRYTPHVGRFILYFRSLFLFQLFWVFVSFDKISAIGPQKLMPPSTSAFGFLCSFMLSFRVLITLAIQRLCQAHRIKVLNYFVRLILLYFYIISYNLLSLFFFPRYTYTRT